MKKLLFVAVFAFAMVWNQPASAVDWSSPQETLAGYRWDVNDQNDYYLNTAAQGFTLKFLSDASNYYFRMDMTEFLYEYLGKGDTLGFVIEQSSIDSPYYPSFFYEAAVTSVPNGNQEFAFQFSDSPSADSTNGGNYFLEWTTDRIFGDDPFELYGYANLWEFEEYGTETLTVTTTPTPTPVPGAVWLLGSGLAGLLALKRRQK